jgi:hypothetical protein
MGTTPNGSALRTPSARTPVADAPDLDIDGHLAAGTTPPGWTPAQWSRVQGLAAKNKAANEQLATLRLEAEAHAATKAELSAAQMRHASDTAMLSSGLPQLADGEIRDYVRERYDAYARGAGENPQSFGDWFAAQKTKPSPLLAPFLSAPAAQPAQPAAQPAAQAGGQPAAQPAARPAQPANPAAGTGQPAPATATTVTTEQIATAASNPQVFRQQSAVIRESLEAKYGTKIGN